MQLLGTQRKVLLVANVLTTWSRFSKATQPANLGLAEFFFSISEPANHMNLYENKLHCITFYPALNIKIRAFWWKICLVFGNKLAEKLWLDLGLE